MSAPPPDVEPSPLTFRPQPVYQPILALQTRTVVGFEALTRPPVGSPWAVPEQMFHAAEKRRETAAFDWQCRLTALAGALSANLPAEIALFVNAEPAALDADPPQADAGLLVAARRLSVVIEITERRLMHDPAGLLRAVEHARDLGWRIAVDDVGSDTSSLALLALLRPDVIKLDRRLIQQRPTDETASILAAVTAESGRTGAIVLAEGIENESHEQWARDIGATWGQGWLYGAPADLPEFGSGRHVSPELLAEPAVTVRAPAAVTPYGLTHSLGPTQRSDDSRLEAIENDLLARAALLGSTALVLVTVPGTTSLPDARFEALRVSSARHALTAVFGSRTVDRSASGIRWIEIGDDEPLALERSVIVVDPAFHGALMSVYRGSDARGVPVFDYLLSFDHSVVLDAATLLMRRIPASSVSAGSSSCG